MRKGVNPAVQIHTQYNVDFVYKLQYSFAVKTIVAIQDLRSPPSCMPRPVCFAALPLCSRIPGLALVGMKFSNVRRRRATVKGVLAVRGVLGQALWAGLGVILTKSEKSKF